MSTALFPPGTSQQKSLSAIRRLIRIRAEFHRGVSTFPSSTSCRREWIRRELPKWRTHINCAAIRPLSDFSQSASNAEESKGFSSTSGAQNHDQRENSEISESEGPEESAETNAADKVSDVDLEELLNSLNLVETTQHVQSPVIEDVQFCKDTANKFERFLSQFCQRIETSDISNSEDLAQGRELLSAENVSLAFWMLSKCRYEPQELSQKARQWEKYLGQLKSTPLTDTLSLRLLVANAKAGNVGRVLSLLQLRRARSFPPSEEEYNRAVRSLQISSWSQHKDGVRNIFLHDSQQPEIDNPTRWLDAILLNMSQRGFPLTTPIANRMIDCYSATGGRTGKAVHHFYRVVRQGILTLSPEEQPKYTDEMPHDYFYVPESEKLVYQPIKVKVKFNEGAPPFYKVPSTAKGRLLYDQNSEIGKLKLDQELEPEYSQPLAAAFAFADSLQHGACGHEPIVLDVGSYNALIKACVCRGALWRAMHVLDTTMKSAGISPNTRSYNFLLSGLAAVGDVVTSQEYFLKMHNSGIQPDSQTVSTIVDGLLNMNDMPGAVTVVQDFFNQHMVLPHVWTHSKILELCLGQGMVYEAKRYCYFIQQLWKWEPNKYHSEAFVDVMRTTQKSPGLQKEALKKMFAYFGEELKESDFLP